MIREDFEKQMLKIQIAYNKKFSSDELKLWFKEFMATDVKEFEKAIDKTIREVIFTPNIADIRSKIAVNPNYYYIDDPYAYLYKNLEWGKFVK